MQKTIIAIMLLLLIMGASLEVTAQDGNTPTPQPLIAAPTQVSILAPTPFPTNTPRFSPTPVALSGDHFWMSRPFAYDPNGLIADYPARGYAYGSTANNSLMIHHGIDIQNSTGTWIRAVAAGTVFYAGPDLNTTFGPRPDFYGNVIVIEHDILAADGRKVYSLYGHVSSFEVETGERVQVNQTIGGVGAEGVAFGPHLHLEVRLGDSYDYYSTYNPELWVEPWQGYGVFAARVVDSDGNPVMGLRLELIGEGHYFTGWTYDDTTVNGDPFYQENIAIGDMPAGTYDLKVGEIRNVQYRGVVTITAGQVNFSEIHLP